MQTVSLELAKTLKEKGFPQESRHAYYVDKYMTNLWEKEKYIETIRREVIDSPTADEILDLLPDQLEHNPKAGWLLITKNKALEYELGYGTTGGFIDGHMTDKSLADAAAQMWLYLKENGFLESAE